MKIKDKVICDDMIYKIVKCTFYWARYKKIVHNLAANLIDKWLCAILIDAYYQDIW